MGMMLNSQYYLIDNIQISRTGFRIGFELFKYKTKEDRDNYEQPMATQKYSIPLTPEFEYDKKGQPVLDKNGKHKMAKNVFDESFGVKLLQKSGNDPYKLIYQILADYDSSFKGMTEA